MSYKPLKTRIIAKIFNNGEQRFYPQYRKPGFMRVFGWETISRRPGRSEFEGKSRHAPSEYDAELVSGFVVFEEAKAALQALENQHIADWAVGVKSTKVISR